jgi:glycolate oxidase iron-sulfur subunit
MDSPRGRIYLMRGLQDGSLETTDEVVRHLDLCLGCRACESACPSGVRYGELIEGARTLVEQRHRRPPLQVWKRSSIAAVFPEPAHLRALLRPLGWLQRLRLWPLLRTLVPAARLLPRVEPPVPLPEISTALGSERARVGLLAGCVARELFGNVHAATIRVLNRNGITVVVPPQAGCCGALDLHSGDPARARARARELLRAIPADLDAIVVNAAGCGSTLKEYGHLLAADPAWAEVAHAFARRVRDVNEYLHQLGIEPPRGTVRERVAYHDACHLAHGQQIREAPRALLRAIPGLELIELHEADTCCGSAGTYNLTEPEMARRLQERKVGHVLASGATRVAAANPGCALQIEAGLRERGAEVRVVHPVELLDEAYRGEPG